MVLLGVTEAELRVEVLPARSEVEGSEEPGHRPLAVEEEGRARIGLEGGRRFFGEEVDRPGEGVRAVKHGGEALRDADLREIRRQKAAVVEVAVIGDIDRHAVGEDGDAAGIEAPDADGRFVAPPHAADVDAADAADGVGEGFGGVLLHGLRRQLRLEEGGGCLRVGDADPPQVEAFGEKRRRCQGEAERFHRYGFH